MKQMEVSHSVRQADFSTANAAQLTSANAKDAHGILDTLPSIAPAVVPCPCQAAKVAAQPLRGVSAEQVNSAPS